MKRIKTLARVRWNVADCEKLWIVVFAARKEIRRHMIHVGAEKKKTEVN